MAKKQGLMSKIIDGHTEWTKVPSGWQTREGRPLFHLSNMLRGHSLTEEDATLCCAARELQETLQEIVRAIAEARHIGVPLVNRACDALRKSGIR